MTMILALVFFLRFTLRYIFLKLCFMSHRIHESSYSSIIQFIIVYLEHTSCQASLELILKIRSIALDKFQIFGDYIFVPDFVSQY